MLSRKSRSLEHILDSGSSSSRSSADTAAAAVATMTLPRLRRCAEVPGMWRAEYGGNTDTMRSCRSINSIKSVQVQSSQHGQSGWQPAAVSLLFIFICTDCVICLSSILKSPCLCTAHLQCTSCALAALDSDRSCRYADGFKIDWHRIIKIRYTSNSYFVAKKKSLDTSYNNLHRLYDSICMFLI